MQIYNYEYTGNTIYSIIIVCSLHTDCDSQLMFTELFLLGPLNPIGCHPKCEIPISPPIYPYVNVCLKLYAIINKTPMNLREKQAASQLTE